MTPMFFGYVLSWVMIAGAAFMLALFIISYVEGARQITKDTGLSYSDVTFARVACLASAAMLLGLAYGWALFVRAIG